VTARDRIVLLVVAAVALVAGSWMLLIQPKRAQASRLGTQVQALQTQLSTARAEVAKGVAARSEFASDYTQLARLGEALPQDDNVPSLIYQVQSAASAAHVDFRSLQMVPASGTPTTPAPSTPAGGAAAAGSSSSGSSSSSAGSAAGTPGASATGTLPPGAALGPAGFPTEQFTFEFTGDFFHLSDFFARLQRFVVAHNNTITVSGRLMTINAISLGAGPKGFPQITANVSATTYMAPASTGLLNGATPSGPAGAPGTAGGSSSSSGAPAAATITPSLR